MKPRCCPYCSQPLPEIRMGVRLSPLKARIFDLILRSADNGITREDIHAIAFDGCDRDANNISVHVAQINDRLVETEYRIVGRGFYRLKRVREVDHAGMVS